MGGRLTIDNRINKYITSLSKFIKFHLKDKTFSRYNSFQNYSDNLYTIIFVSIRLSKSRGKKIKFRDSNVHVRYFLSFLQRFVEKRRSIEVKHREEYLNAHTVRSKFVNFWKDSIFFKEFLTSLRLEREIRKNIHFDAIWSKKIDLKGNLILTEGRRKGNYAREISKFEEGIYLYA